MSEKAKCGAESKLIVNGKARLCYLPTGHAGPHEVAGDDGNTPYAWERWECGTPSPSGNRRCTLKDGHAGDLHVYEPDGLRWSGFDVLVCGTACPVLLADRSLFCDLTSAHEGCHRVHDTRGNVTWTRGERPVISVQMSGEAKVTATIPAGFATSRLCGARPPPDAGPHLGAPCVLWPDHRGDHIDALNRRWSQEPAKPSPDLCDATASRDGGAYRCSMTKGHAGYHVELAANGVPNAVWPPEKIREEGPAKCGNVRRAAGFELRCTLASGHAGSHEAHDGGGFVDRWANAADENGGDKVNHPTHYNTHPAGIECIDVIEHMTFNVGTAIKYLWRAGLKAGSEHDEDLRKAIWYIERERARVAKKAGG